MYLPPDEKRMGAPYGIAHGKATVPFETVEAVRTAHENGDKPAVLAKRYGLSVNTINDWVHFRTRCYC
jgi:hypothetical protein